MKRLDFDSPLIRRVTKEAKCIRAESDYDRYQISAVIFDKRKVISTGTNMRKTAPVQCFYNKYRKIQCLRGWSHAEINALGRLKRLGTKVDPKNLAILVYREYKNGVVALARPCPACEQALRDFGITDIYYTGDNSMCYEKYK